VLTVVLPAVLGMSAFRLVQLPRGLRARRAIIHPRRRLLCALASGVVYIALAAHTILALLAVARLLWTPPETIHDLWAAANVEAGYPHVYLAFVRVLYYSVKPVSRA
jgi:hypothetical protein